MEHVNRTAWAARARAVFCICVMFASGILAPLLNINFLSDMISPFTFGNMSRKPVFDLSRVLDFTERCWYAAAINRANKFDNFYFYIIL